jgi:hypothetical protein
MRTKTSGIIAAIRLGVVGALACLAVANARAADTGFFLNADLGASFIQGLPAGVDGSTGVRFSFVPGYRLYSGVAGELSVQFDTGVIWNPYSIKWGFHSVDGDIYQLPVLGGLEYAFHAGKGFVPYIGAAGGGVYNERDFSETYRDFYLGAGSKNGFYGAVQGMAGIRYRINDFTDLGLGYKYLASFGPGSDTLGNHSVSLTLVLRF